MMVIEEQAHRVENVMQCSKSRDESSGQSGWVLVADYAQSHKLCSAYELWPYDVPALVSLRLISRGIIGVVVSTLLSMRENSIVEDLDLDEVVSIENA